MTDKATDFETMTAVEKAVLCKEIAERLVSETEKAIALQQMHEVGAYDTAIPDAFNNTFEAWGYNITIQALYWDLVMTILKMFDPPDPGTASLRTLNQLLEDDDVISELEKETRLWGETHFGKEGNCIEADGLTRAEYHARARVKKLRMIGDQFASIGGRHLEASLRKIRNEIVGHSATSYAPSGQKTGARSAKWGDADDLLKSILPIIALINEALLQNGWEADELASIWYTYARRFWRQVSPPAASD